MIASVSPLVAVASAVLGLAQPARPIPAADSATLVTMLGRDTVVMESYTQSASKIEGHMLVRVPGTVLMHYVIDLDAAGDPTHSMVDIKPLGTKAVGARRVAVDFKQDSAFVDVDSVGHHRLSRMALPSKALPQLMTGFGSYYGLYETPTLFEHYQPVMNAPIGDTVRVSTFDIANGRSVKRRFIRRSATQIDADYFAIAWNHVTLDDAGHVVGVDATETTERTLTTRAGFMDLQPAAERFAAEDRAGKGIGVASPSAIAKSTFGGAAVVVGYSSPRRRGRTILGSVVPYGEVWRTGANEATTLFADTSLNIGGATIPAGIYSLWTLPREDGSVDLIVNSQHGQWGTDYDSKNDVAHIPMTVTKVATPADDFAIKLVNGSPGSLQIAWDTFVWSVPISVAK